MQYVQASVYELAEHFPDPFDLVIFWGVLYHLRHPLLALDNLRAVTRWEASLESAVCDSELPAKQRSSSLSQFYRRDELAGDTSNWFAPTVVGLRDWCISAGFTVLESKAWPEPAQRAMLKLRPVSGEPEWQQISYERPLRCRVEMPKTDLEAGAGAGRPPGLSARRCRAAPPLSSAACCRRASSDSIAWSSSASTIRSWTVTGLRSRSSPFRATRCGWPKRG